MRRPLDAAPAARHALLGLLQEQPRHGYDLARAFAPGTPLGSVVHLGASHLYALLAQLERDGLVEGERAEPGSRPPRRIYHLTPAGQAALTAWLAEPVSRPRDLTVDFPLKLYLARRLDPHGVPALLRRQRAVFETYLHDLEQEAVAAATPVDAAFLSLLRESRIGRTRAALEWLDHCATWVAGQ
jgi:PadR family transcriptional regulator AphA